jgi:hypothetical protein
LKRIANGQSDTDYKDLLYILPTDPRASQLGVLRTRPKVLLEAALFIR